MYSITKLESIYLSLCRGLWGNNIVDWKNTTKQSRWDPNNLEHDEFYSHTL